MEKFLNSVQDYIKSGEYFSDARIWYNEKYLFPLTQRSMIVVLVSIMLWILVILLFSIYCLFPINRQVRYAISSTSIKNAKIILADHIDKDPISSIADIMIKNYLIHRESYDYSLLSQQFKFVQNNSTRIIFIQFANYMNIDNPISPVMRYQRDLRRSINIESVVYRKNNEAVIVFSSLIKTLSNEILEHLLWRATVNFEIDPIDVYVPTNSRFNFAITGYKLKLLQDKQKKY